MNNRYIKLENKNINKELEQARESEINNLIKTFLELGRKENMLLENIRLNILNGHFEYAVNNLKRYIETIDSNLTNSIKIRSSLVNNMQYFSKMYNTGEQEKIYIE